MYVLLSFSATYFKSPGPGFTKILKLMLKLRHIISVFVSREIMLKLVFSKVISCENKLKLSLYVSKHFIG